MKKLCYTSIIFVHTRYIYILCFIVNLDQLRNGSEDPPKIWRGAHCIVPPAVSRGCSDCRPIRTTGRRHMCPLCPSRRAAGMRRFVLCEIEKLSEKTHQRSRFPRAHWRRRWSKRSPPTSSPCRVCGRSSPIASKALCASPRPSGRPSSAGRAILVYVLGSKHHVPGTLDINCKRTLLCCTIRVQYSLLYSILLHELRVFDYLA